MSRPFVMLDRDGTLITRRHYLSDPDQVEILPGVSQAFCQLREVGVGLVLISNQSGIGRGSFNLERLQQIHRRLEEWLRRDGAFLDGYYFCPHRPEEGCHCRKPAPGMVLQAAEEQGFDPAAGFMVGDNVCDIELGKGVGATTILVRTGYGATVEKEGTAQGGQFVGGGAHYFDLDHRSVRPHHPDFQVN